MLRDQQQNLTALAGELARFHLRADGTLIFRHDAADSLSLPPLMASDTRTYGGMTLEFLRLPVETVSM